jgi:hypothetical protein
MEVMKMTRFLKILGIAGFSSVYLMQGACTLSGNGVSFLPNVGTTITGYINTLLGLVT